MIPFVVTASNIALIMTTNITRLPQTIGWWHNDVYVGLYLITKKLEICLATSLSAAVAPTPQGTGARAPTFTNGWARGHHKQKNSQNETDQTVLTIIKALTKTTNCAFRAKKWRSTTKILFWHFAPDRCPHFQIRPGATAICCTPLRVASAFCLISFCSLLGLQLCTQSSKL